MSGWELDPLGLAAEEWADHLLDPTLFSARDIDCILYFFDQPGHGAPASYLVGRFGFSHHAVVNTWNDRLSKQLLHRHELSVGHIDERGKPHFWNVLFTSESNRSERKAKWSGLFPWILRPPIIEAIRNVFVTDGYAGSVTETDEETDLYEGALKRFRASGYERSREARRQCLEIYGYACFLCSFDFKATYGEIGRGLIHVHHLTPLSARQGEIHVVDPAENLRPICPNCHLVIHSREPALTFEEVRRRSPMLRAND
jgi:5-methylcytosine-specific restriction protein A